MRTEEVEAWGEKSEQREQPVVKIRAKVTEKGNEATVEREARLFKGDGEIVGYIIIHVRAEGGPEADYLRTAVMKTLGVEKWA